MDLRSEERDDLVSLSENEGFQMGEVRSQTIDDLESVGANGNDQERLSRQEVLNMAMLASIYFVAGIPPSLAGGTFPTILKPVLSYQEIGLISVAFYPYSLKLVWSPFVDAVWSSRFGVRKSWIVPCLIVASMLLFALSMASSAMLQSFASEAPSHQTLVLLTTTLTLLVAIVSTQSIATDSWTLVLFSSSKLPYASMAHSLGATAGHFTGYTLFLGLSSTSWSSVFEHSTPDSNLASLGKCLFVTSIFSLALGCSIAVLKYEPSCRRDGTKELIWSRYRALWRVVSLKPVQLLIAVHLVARLGFEANDGATMLKLIDKGVPQGHLAWFSLLTLPFEVICGWLGGRWCARSHPLDVWCASYVARLLATILSQIMMWAFPYIGPDQVVAWFDLIPALAMNVLNSGAATVASVAFTAWHFQVAQKEIGGSYIALLAT